MSVPDADEARRGWLAAVEVSDTHHWEVLDPETMRPVPDGHRGSSVVTNLLSDASPQLRFVVGDYTGLTGSRVVAVAPPPGRWVGSRVAPTTC